MFNRINWYNVFIHIILLGLSIVVILLINKNKTLEEKLNYNKLDNIKESDIIENILTLNLEGKEELINFNEGKDKILFLFTTTCKFCTENIPKWKEIYEDKKDKYEIIGLGLDSLETIKSYSEFYELPYKILISNEKNFRNKYKIQGVPQTIYLEKNIVKKVKIGVL